MKKLLVNAKIFDGKQNKITSGNIFINGNKISKVTEKYEPIYEDIDVIDLEGQYVMPGLIDAHVHVTANLVNLYQENEHQAAIYAKSFKEMHQMLLRGFTSVRDAGGADAGILDVLDKKIICGPRLFISGKALSQTAGHGDFRHKTDAFEPCACSLKSASSISMICDGVSAVRKATREQLRQGASQIKIMASGGIASPTDKVTNLQFSDEEISAIVDEANHFGTYVMAHAYTPEAIIRSIKLGVKSIEHGNLLNMEAAKVMSQHKAYLVPTLAIYNAFTQYGSIIETPAHTLEKLQLVQKQALESIKCAKDNGVSVGFGTDLLGELMQYQSTEFKLRSKVDTPFETLHSATYVNAKMMNMEGKLGIISNGAFADLLVLKENPLENIELFDENGSNISMIIQDGKFIKQ
ncbi:metal-dependent hydrolase family protein [Photobacterium angustum]|nr:amidohydrolase family protein [Photobacterium angustum]